MRESALLVEAERCFRSRHYQNAYPMYLELAKAGNLLSARRLGLVFFHGLGQSVDLFEAMLWFKKAADLGDNYSMHMMGMIFLEQRDESGASHIFKGLAEREYPPSMARLGELWIRDPELRDTALEMLKNASRMGSVKAGKILSFYRLRCGESILWLFGGCMHLFHASLMELAIGVRDVYDERLLI